MVVATLVCGRRGTGGSDGEVAVMTVVTLLPALAVLPGSGAVAVRYSSHSFLRRLESGAAVTLCGCSAIAVAAAFSDRQRHMVCASHESMAWRQGGGHLPVEALPGIALLEGLHRAVATPRSSRMHNDCCRRCQKLCVSASGRGHEQAGVERFCTIRE